MTEKELLIRDKYNNDASDEAAIAKDMERLACGEPLAYVIGWIPFLGLNIELSAPTHPEVRALIPRPETEWWTEKLIAHLREEFADRPFSLLDLCAGSGAIGLAILQAFPNARVTFADLVPELAELIKSNVEINNLDVNRVRIVTSDVYSTLSDAQFDIVATNPPYIPEGRKLDASVSNFEPHSALFSGVEGMDVINRIIDDAHAHLNTSGELWMECDIANISAAAERSRALDAHATIHEDLSGRPRLLVAHFE